MRFISTKNASCIFNRLKTASAYLLQTSRTPRAVVTSQTVLTAVLNMAAYSNDTTLRCTESDPVPLKRRKNGLYCAVANCNSKQADGLSLHLFPTEVETRRQWVQFVQTCRADFEPSYGTPNKYSSICQLHFSPESYPASHALRKSFQMKTRNTLNRGAVPTIQKPCRPLPPSLAMPMTVMTTASTVTVTQSQSASTSLIATTAVTAPVCSTVMLTGVSSIRGAYKKREHKRVLADILTSSTHDIESNSEVKDMQDECTTADEKIHTTTVHSCCQTDGTWNMEKGHAKKIMRSKKIQVNPHTAMKSVQCDFLRKPSMHTKETQCNLELDQSYDAQPLPVPAEQQLIFSDASSEEEMEQEYVPFSDESEITTDDEIESPARSTSSTMRKFIVFESALLELFKTCRQCGQLATHYVGYIKGSMVRVNQECPHCRHSWSWDSQPFFKDIPAGNLLMSASILFSGSLPTKVLRFLHHMGVAAISDDTFYNHQNAFLQPSVQEEWLCWQKQYCITAKASGRDLTLGGDGRADSPGHCAKYGTYTVMDLDIMHVVDIELVQSNEVGNSCRMEKEGLVRAVNFFYDAGLAIAEIITDRHPMIIKYVRENMKGTKHSIDVWHVGKGLKKKLVKLSSETECWELANWTKSIVNHLYWVAASTPQADEQLMLEKWLSLTNHVHNVHTHTGHTTFPACLHPTLGHNRKKKWIKEGTKLSVKLSEIIQSRQMSKDIRMLSTGPQTAAIEAFHSVLNHFAPKMVGFSFEGQLSRNIVAALHFNENNDRNQITDQAGRERYNLVFKKSKKDFSVQEIKEDQTFDYVERLMKRVMHLASTKSIYEMEKVQQMKRQAAPLPPPLCAAFQKPNKEEAVQSMKSRYSKNKKQ